MAAPTSSTPSLRRWLPLAVVVFLAIVLIVLLALAGDEEPAADPPVDDVEEEPEPDPEPDPDADPEPDPDEPEPDPEPEVTAPDLDVEVTLTEVTVMDSPIAGAVGPDGLLYLAERAGTVHALTTDGPGEPLVDITAETSTDSERGLLGIAFAPDGSALYLSFTDPNGDSVVDAVLIEDGEIVGDQRRTILTVEQPYANHNGGDIHIGPDGMLYIGLGDGGSGGDPLGAGQDTSTLLGSLVRIDPAGGDPYAVPDDNPFVDDAAAAEEIWAYGLRNPWRFSFDREEGDLWIADVGQNAREEINVMPAGEGAGANYGWNAMEGTLEFEGPEPDDHVPPVHEYDTTASRCAVTGGVVYRGAAIPELSGAYLFSDYCEGALRAIVVEDGEVVDEGELGVGGDAIVSFAQDADGEVYLLDLSGPVYRLDAA